MRLRRQVQTCRGVGVEVRLRVTSGHISCREDAGSVLHMAERPDLSKSHLTACPQRIPILRVNQTTTMYKKCGHGIILHP